MSLELVAPDDYLFQYSWDHLIPTLAMSVPLYFQTQERRLKNTCPKSLAYLASVQNEFNPIALSPK